jgi:hypothetical protein
VSRPDLEPHVIYLLRRAADAPELPEAELDALQERHVAYQQRLRAEARSRLPVPSQTSPTSPGAA